MVRAELEVGQNLHRHLRTNGEHDHVAAVQYGLIGFCDRDVGKFGGEGGSHFRIARRDRILSRPASEAFSPVTMAEVIAPGPTNPSFMVAFVLRATRARPLSRFRLNP
jgi:hypothetical protein